MKPKLHIVIRQTLEDSSKTSAYMYLETLEMQKQKKHPHRWKDNFKHPDIMLVTTIEVPPNFVL